MDEIFRGNRETGWSFLSKRSCMIVFKTCHVKCFHCVSEKTRYTAYDFQNAHPVGIDGMIAVEIDREHQTHALGGQLEHKNSFPSSNLTRTWVPLKYATKYAAAYFIGVLQRSTRVLRKYAMSGSDPEQGDIIRLRIDRELSSTKCPWFLSA